jgi:hypothetical protein
MTLLLQTPAQIESKAVDLIIEEVVEEVRALNGEIKTLESCVAAKKEQLRRLLERRGESWSDETGGYARLVKDSTRATYDREALDALTLRSPWWHKRLNKYRRETPVRGGVQVK